MQITVQNSDETPASGVTVTAVAASDNTVREAVTDAQGVADFGALAAGDYEVFARDGALTTQVRVETEATTETATLDSPSASATLIEGGAWDVQASVTGAATADFEYSTDSGSTWSIIQSGVAVSDGIASYTGGTIPAGVTNVRVVAGAASDSAAVTTSTLLAEVPSIVRLFETDRGAWQDTGGTTTATAENDPIARLDEIAGTGEHVEQATASKQPVLHIDADGRKWVRFDGADDWLGQEVFAVQAITHGIVWCVYRMRLISGDSQVVWQIRGGLKEHFVWNRVWNYPTYAQPELAVRPSSPSDFRRGETGQEVDTTYMIRNQKTASGTTDWKVVLNDYDQTLYNSVGSPEANWIDDLAHDGDGTDRLYLGARGAELDMYAQLDLAFWAITDGMPTTAQIELVEDYLRAKYSVPYVGLGAAVAPLATNAASPLTTPTYDGSGQATHPDVVDAQAVTGSTWNGHRYWMAMTPYPGANDAYENPSILVSSDLVTWSVPNGLTNPIAPKPANGYNSDTDLVIMPDGSKAVLVYRETNTTTGETTVLYQESTDGVTWTSAQTLIAPSTSPPISPTLVYQSSAWHLWYWQSGDQTMYYRTAATLAGLDAATEQACTITLPTTQKPWHLDVIYDSGASEWRMILNCNLNGTGGAAASGGTLWYLTSPDKLAWTAHDTPVLEPSDSGWDDEGIYRASLVKAGTDYELIYGGISSSNAWRIGRTQFTIPT